MSLEQINVPFTKYFIDKMEGEFKLALGRDVDMDDISAYIFLLATSGYLKRKEMR